MSCDKEMQDNIQRDYYRGQAKVIMFGTAGETVGEAFKRMWDDKALPYNFVPEPNVWEGIGESAVGFFKAHAEEAITNLNNAKHLFMPITKENPPNDEVYEWPIMGREPEKYRGISSGLNTLWHLEDREIAQGVKDFINSQNQESGPMPDITRILPGPDGIGKVVVYGTIDKGHKRKGKFKGKR